MRTGAARRLRRFSLHIIAIGALLVIGAGCPQYRHADVPAPILQRIEPESQCLYRLYVPSIYDRAYKWPLVILCHGTVPWDTSRRQMADWVRLAEVHGFLVAAPELSGTSRLRPPPAEKQIARQLLDERSILGVLRHIRGAYNVSSDRIFLTGWSAGCYAVLHTGLKHSDVFRALAVQHGNFEAVYLSDVAGGIDPHQPICVIYGASDFLAGKESRRCIEWLQSHRANVIELELPGGHRADPKRAQEFFERVLRQIPWLHIRSFGVDGADPLTVQFKTRGSFKPETYAWSFGDGSDSPVAEPVHRYADPGTYRVTLLATTLKGKPVQRAIELEVPQLHAIKPQRTTWDD